jgi:hypothetical protein
MPTVVINGSGPLELAKRQRCGGNNWREVRADLIVSHPSLALVLPSSADVSAASAFAFFVNGRRVSARAFFEVAFEPDDELAIVQAISGG